MIEKNWYKVLKRRNYNCWKGNNKASEGLGERRSVSIAVATSKLSVILSFDGNVLITRLSRGHAWCILEKGFTQLCHPQQGGFDQAL